MLDVPWALQPSPLPALLHRGSSSGQAGVMVEVHSRPIVLDCHGRTRENEVFHDAVPHASNLTAMKLVLRLRKSFYIA